MLKSPTTHHPISFASLIILTPLIRRTGILLALILSAGIAFTFWGKEKNQNEPAESQAFVNGWRLAPSQPAYLHDAIVELTLATNNEKERDQVRQSTAPLFAWVERGTRTIETIGALDKVRLSWDKDAKLWRGGWPVPWNAPDGSYRLRIDTAALPSEVDQVAFEVKSRKFEPVKSGMGVLTLEGLKPLNRFVGPEGGTPTVKALADWADYIGADTVIIQGAESSGHGRKLPSAFPWLMRSTESVKALAAECDKRGIKVGVYVLCFMIGGPPEYSPDYQYGWHYDGGPIYGLNLPKRRGVSIAEEKRPKDIVKVLNAWADVPGVDFLGLDYIRPVFGSWELVDDFVADMPGVVAPPGFNQMSKEDRMRWIARNGRYLAPRQEQRKEPKYRLADQWFWYRAHRTAAVVRKIAEEFNGRLPLWAFTLSWQKGWEHAQDPVMMRDAGIDMDGIMLYEANDAQYRGLVKQWGEYATRGQLNLVVGNTYDWNLHQRTLNPAGPESMYNRTMMAVQGFHKDGPVRGIFMHDLPRALGVSRRSPYSTKEWMLASGAAITRTRELNNALPYELKVQIATTATAAAPLTGKVSFAGKSSEDPVEIELMAGPDVELSNRRFALSHAVSSATFTLHWRPNAKSTERANRTFVALRAARPAQPKERAQVHMRYIQGQRRQAAPEPADPVSPDEGLEK